MGSWQPAGPGPARREGARRRARGGADNRVWEKRKGTRPARTHPCASQMRTPLAMETILPRRRRPGGAGAEFQELFLLKKPTASAACDDKPINPRTAQAPLADRTRRPEAARKGARVCVDASLAQPQLLVALLRGCSLPCFLSCVVSELDRAHALRPTPLTALPLPQQAFRRWPMSALAQLLSQLRCSLQPPRRAGGHAAAPAPPPPGRLPRSGSADAKRRGPGGGRRLVRASWTPFSRADGPAHDGKGGVRPAPPELLLSLPDEWDATMRCPRVTLGPARARACCRSLVIGCSIPLVAPRRHRRRRWRRWPAR